MNDLMGEYYTIHNLPALHIARLLRLDDLRKKGLESVGYDFGNDFVKNITESDGPEFVRGGGVLFFGNESDEGGIKRG